jgi:hypothetical protein
MGKESKMLTDIKKVRGKVIELLDEYPNTRDSDKLLWLAYLVTYHDLRNVIGDLAYTRMKEIVMDKNTASMESIRRVRQKIQEDGLYLGTKRKQKKEESKVVREYFKGK